MMLEYRTAGDVSSAATVAVLLHGRGADADDMLGVARALPDSWAVVAPRAPFPGAPWGYGPGRAWYRYLGGNRPDAESFSASLTALEELLTELPKAHGFDTGRIVLGGFSQGGTVSLGYALSHAAAPPVLNFSGFLADHAEVDAARAGALGTRVFWGHGTHDPAIPFTMAVAGRRALVDGGASVQARDYQIGHWIDDAELRDAIDWVHGLSG